MATKKTTAKKTTVKKATVKKTVAKKAAPKAAAKKTTAKKCSGAYFWGGIAIALCAAGAFMVLAYGVGAVIR